MSAGLASLLFGISRANAWGWTSPRVLGLILGGLAVLVLFVRHESRVDGPLVDMRVMRGRAVLATNAAGFLIGVAMFGSFLVVPQFVQAPESTGYGFGMTVTAAGLLMLPSALMMLVAGPVGGQLGNRLGFRTVLATGTVLCALSFLVLAVAHSAEWHFGAANVLLGVGLSFAFAAMANIIVTSVPPEQVGIATGINTVTRTVGGAFGAALVTALLTAETIPGTPVPTEAAYSEAFIAATIAGFVALGATLLVPTVRAARQAAPVSREVGERVAA